MNKVFAVIGGQVFISQAVVEQAALAISKVVVMDCSTGELKFAEKPVALGDEVLLEQLRQAAENGARAAYQTALEDFKQDEERKAQLISEMSARAKADEALATYVMTLGRMTGDDPADAASGPSAEGSRWQIKIAATPEGMLYAAGIGMGAALPKDFADASAKAADEAEQRLLDIEKRLQDTELKVRSLWECCSKFSLAVRVL